MTMDESDSVEEAAAHWLQAIEENPQVRHSAEFLEWASASPEHIVALRRAKKVDDRLHEFIEEHAIDVDALVEEAREEQRRLAREDPRRKTRALSMAAVGIVVLTLLYMWVPKQTYVTRDGEQEIHLVDGSSVVLNTDSEVEVAFSRRVRDLYLKKGKGKFTVHHDEKRPFRVHAADGIVEAVGTEFEVSLIKDRMDVKVVEGVVQLKPSTSLMQAVTGKPKMESRTVTAGQSLTVYPDGRSEWRDLTFQNEPLAKIVEWFNRSNSTRQFRIEGDRLRERRFVLVLKNAEPESLIRNLELYQTLEIVSQGNIIIIRERRR